MRPPRGRVGRGGGRGEGQEGEMACGRRACRANGLAFAVRDAPGSGWKCTVLSRVCRRRRPWAGTRGGGRTDGAVQGRAADGQTAGATIGLPAFRAAHFQDAFKEKELGRAVPGVPQERKRAGGRTCCGASARLGPLRHGPTLNSPPNAAIGRFWRLHDRQGEQVITRGA